MINRSQRGAAKVGVIWMVGALVAILVIAVMFFLVSQQKTQEEERANAAEARAKDYEARLTAELTQVRDMSKVVGFYDEATGATRTEMSALSEGFKALQAAFPDRMDPSITNFQTALPRVVQAYADQQARVKDLETQITTLKAQNEECSKNARDMTEASAKELATLRTQIADTEQAKTDMQADLERQLAEARDSLKDRDAKWRTAQTQIDENKRLSDREKEALRTRLNEQGRKLNPFTKEPESADGRILGVSQDLGLGWIGLGSKNRLAVGTRFRVVGGASGSKKVKGWAEVTRVESDMAEVVFQDQSDPFDPPVVGDVVFNPLFDPTGERHAVLIGRFSGAVNEAQLKALLANMGVNVQQGLDKSTDFLIVGAELYSDENGQPLETPMAPSDLPIYKDAVADGVQIVQLKDLRQYFRF